MNTSPEEMLAIHRRRVAMRASSNAAVAAKPTTSTVALTSAISVAPATSTTIPAPGATSMSLQTSPVPTYVPTAPAMSDAQRRDAIATTPLANNHPTLVAKLQADGTSLKDARAQILEAEGRRQNYSSDSSPAATNIRPSSTGDDANVIATAQGVELGRRAVIYQSKVRGEGRKISIHQAINELELLGK